MKLQKDRKALFHFNIATGRRLPVGPGTCSVRVPRLHSHYVKGRSSSMIQGARVLAGTDQEEMHIELLLLIAVIEKDT